MSKLKIYPFGGVGEIGSNMTIFETTNHIVIIDYGILFPYDDFFDINYLIPDTSQINQDKEVTLFVTHGHEDHIGAIPHIVRDIPKLKILAPEFATVLIRAKLERRKLSKEITVYDHTDEFKFDEFTLHPIHVTHSIPQTHGLVFHSPEFSTLFISDFKYDENPLFEDKFDLLKIKKLMNSSQKTLAMMDSTNILNHGKTLSESELSPDLTKIISRKQRTFITLFSSNFYRVKNILEIAKANKRTIVPIGRSIHFYLAAAEKSGLIKLADYNIKELDSIDNPESPNNLFIVTGSQGEYLGASRRIISGEQKHLKLKEDDIFVFSSKPIPGNEKQIYRLFNQIAEVGAEVITYKEQQVHASGHPCQEDLHAIIKEINPDYYIPIHGETYFLRKHIEFINTNYSKIETLFLTNFTGVELKQDSLSIIAFEQTQPHLIHGDDLIIERERISERRKLANNGLVIISLNHQKVNINIETRGLPNMIQDYIPKLRDLVEYCAYEENKKRDYDYKTEQVRIKTRTFLNSILGYKPITIVQMV